VLEWEEVGKGSRRRRRKTGCCNSLVGRDLGSLGGKDMTGDAAGLRHTLARRRVASDCNHGNGLTW
jgi:hypothetical protein